MSTVSTPSQSQSVSLSPADSKTRVSEFMKQMQDKICQTLEHLDGRGKFQQDKWEREEGRGRSRVISNGAVFEKGGVNFSEVWGSHLPPSILRKRPEASGNPWFATGISLVLHPHNPYIPTVHFNYRYFEAGSVWWFGGGADLTPYYPFAEDACHFHKIHKNACDRHHPEYYAVFKRWCDEYFYLRHRQETRGVGGLFFDYQDGRGHLYRGANLEGAASVYSNQIGTSNFRTWEQLFAFIGDCCEAFLPAYLPILERRQNIQYGTRERNFQLYRRGRYVEFNLVYDRGTIFGLQTKGRTESILMSLPPLVRWDYSYNPKPNTPEAELYKVFLKPQDWSVWTPSSSEYS